MNSTKDFDAFWAEQEQESIPFKLFGQQEYLPPSLPATMVLRLLELEDAHGVNDLPHGEILQLTRLIFGEGKLEEWARKGLTTDQMQDLIEWAMEQYNPKNRPALQGQGQK